MRTSGVLRGTAVDVRAHAGHGREVARGGHAGRRPCGAAGRVDGPDVEVLVAVHVLHVEHGARVAAPEVAGHRPLVGGQRARGRRTARRPLDPDVADALVRLDEADEGAVGADLRAGDLRIAEEQFAVDDGRHGRGDLRCGFLVLSLLAARGRQDDSGRQDNQGRSVACGFSRSRCDVGDRIVAPTRRIRRRGSRDLGQIRLDTSRGASQRRCRHSG